MKINYNKRKHLLSILLVSLLFASFLSAFSIVNFAYYTDETNSSYINYTSIAEIVIDSNADFISYGFPGNGSAINPYIIDNYHISGAYEGISIVLTSVYFIIQNCLVDGSGTGIYLTSIATGTVQIIGNTIETNNVGIYLHNTHNAKIADNTITGNIDCGILIEYSATAVIANNTLISNEIVFGYDFDYYDLIDYQVNNNTLNGKPIAWLTSETDQILSSEYAQIILVDCSRITVKDQAINYPKTGIHIIYSDDIIADNNSCGIEIRHSEYVDVINSKFDDRDLEIFASSYVAVQQNTYDSGDFAIYVEDSSNNIVIKDNYCKDQSFGISIEESSNCLVEDNICENAIEDGIYLYLAYEITIRNNIIQNCRDNGIYLTGTSNCEIYQNVLYENLQYGVNLDDEESAPLNNLIYRNIFIGNNRGGTQAQDNGGGNYWYNTISLKGNFWNDWIGTNGYTILGTSNNIDLYPLNDSDDDGMPPEWEYDHDLNLWIDDSALDLDNDNLTNIEEFNHQTNPRNSDSDGDGYLDGEEVEQGYDPLDPNNPKKAIFEFIIILGTIGVISKLTKKKTK